MNWLITTVSPSHTNAHALSWAAPKTHLQQEVYSNFTRMPSKWTDKHTSLLHLLDSTKLKPQLLTMHTYSRQLTASIHIVERPSTCSEKRAILRSQTDSAVPESDTKTKWYSIPNVHQLPIYMENWPSIKAKCLNCATLSPTRSARICTPWLLSCSIYTNPPFSTQPNVPSRCLN